MKTFKYTQNEIFSYFNNAFYLNSLRKDNISTVILMEMPVATAVRTYTGSFINGPFGSVTGAVHIVRDTDNKLQLLIKNLKSSKGPDLKVYLSKEL